MMLVLRMPLLVPVLVNKILFINTPCLIFNHLKVRTLRISLDYFQANLVPWIQFHPGLSKGIVTSCFPLSLSHSKVIEKAASRQVVDHVDSNNVGEPLQSSYKRHHSTETALLMISSAPLIIYKAVIIAF